ncbi:tyrosine-protein phosphatase 10D-like [Homalodisca vitripennis]|uniref:tyrosine-protein phosphatase 10D-like n=1 Tax=Homalodisca vitripennis TaxID=197043 RepID=UPI001EEB250C|nr:tyrosine-protein phosphatase 10D-like [Homalodisca vitripennis]
MYHQVHSLDAPGQRFATKVGDVQFVNRCRLYIDDGEERRNIAMGRSLDVGTIDTIANYLDSINPFIGDFRRLGNEPSVNAHLEFQDLSESYSDIYNNSLLKAETSYEVTIIPVGYNGTYGQPKSEIFTVPPRIPAEPDEVKFKSLPPVESSSRSAVVTIHRDTFPNTEGTVRYFAILVAESFPHGPSHGWLTNGTQSTLNTWAKSRQSRPTPPYQARPPWPNPFQSSSLEEVEVEVGSQKCSETDYATYCDGPLESGTAYELRIRAFTATGYRDSQSIKFQTEYPTSPFAIVVILIILAIAIITSVVSFIVWRRWSYEEHITVIRKKSKRKENETSDLCESLTIEQFLQHAENVLSSPGQLKTEFNILENENNVYPQIIAKLEHNKTKNRYGNIFPYDETRVILEGDEINDYINASHVKLQEAKSVNYIACQAPKATSCGDFWKMIFQFRVNIIVMLCMPVEKEKEKCFIYYPSPTEVVMYDDIAIACRKEEEFSSYIVRHIVADKGGVTLEVKQFHFIGWPDFKVPESPDVMVKFVNAVQQVSKGKEHYMVVHCSAGVGRTGTFIALDALMRLIRQKWNCSFNIFDVVHKMRQQRCKMVQTEGQYRYIYECMKYALENHRSPFLKVRMYLYKRSKKARRSRESDGKELLHLEDLSCPQTPVASCSTTDVMYNSDGTLSI